MTRRSASVADGPPLPDVPADAAVPAFATVARLVSFACLACLLILVNLFIGRFVSLPLYTSVAGHSLAVVYLAALLLTLLLAAREAARLPVSTPALLILGAALSMPILLQILSAVAHLKGSLDIVAAFLPFAAQLVVGNLLGPLGMTLLGAGIGRIIKHPNTLLAGSGAAVFFDIVVVTMGTVRQLLSSGSAIIAAVSVGAVGAGTAAAIHHAVVGGAAPPKLPDPVCAVTIGPADVLFMALFLSAVGHLRLQMRTTQQYMYGLLLAALVLVETSGLPIPALAPMGVAVLLANRRHAAFTPQEKRDLRIGAAFAVVCAFGMVAYARFAIRPTAQPPSAAAQGMIGFRLGRAPQTGVYAVMEVVPGSRAAGAGLRPGDAVLALNGKPIASIPPEEYVRLLRGAHAKGITLTIKSGDQPKPRDVVFAPEPDPSRSRP